MPRHNYRAGGFCQESDSAGPVLIALALSPFFYRLSIINRHRGESTGWNRVFRFQPPKTSTTRRVSITHCSTHRTSHQLDTALLHHTLCPTEFPPEHIAAKHQGHSHTSHHTPIIAPCPTHCTPFNTTPTLTPSPETLRLKRNEKPPVLVETGGFSLTKCSAIFLLSPFVAHSTNASGKLSAPWRNSA